MGNVRDSETPLSFYNPPREEPALTLGGNFYYRMHLIMMDIDRAAINCIYDKWYFTLRQLYNNLAPCIAVHQKTYEETTIERLLKEIKQSLAMERVKPEEYNEINEKLDTVLFHAQRNKNKIEKMFDQVEKALFNPLNNSYNDMQKNHHKSINHRFAQKTLMKINQILLAEMDRAKMLFPRIRKRDMGDLSRSMVQINSSFGKRHGMGPTNKGTHDAEESHLGMD